MVNLNPSVKMRPNQLYLSPKHLVVRFICWVVRDRILRLQPDRYFEVLQAGHSVSDVRNTPQ